MKKTLILIQALIAVASCVKGGGEITTEPLHTEEVTVVMAKNETEHYQLVLSTEDNTPLTVEREGNPDQLAFQCRTVASFSGMEDFLVPIKEEIVPEKNKVKAWLSFTSNSNTKPGTYAETIHFKNAVSTYSVKVSVKVMDVTLPLTPSIPAVFGINPDNLLLSGLSQKEKEQARKEISDLLLNYRISPYFCTWLSGTMMLECSSAPFDVKEESFWDYIRDARFSAVALPSANLSDEDLNAMLARAEKEGVLDKAFFYIWDEPTLTSQYSQIQEKADRIHKYAPGARVLTTFYCGPQDGERKGELLGVWDELEKATDIFCTGVWSLSGNENISAQCLAKSGENKQWWCYVCMSDKPGLAFNSVGIPNRAVMWREWKERSQGFLYWVVNAFSSMDPLMVRKELPEGDGVLLVPGQYFGVSTPCVSTRLEYWRDGAEDYELLRNYEKVLGRSSAEKMLQNVYKDPQNYTDTRKYVEAFHKHLIEDVL